MDRLEGKVSLPVEAKLDFENMTDSELAFSLMNDMDTDPTHLGFTDVIDPRLTTSLCADPDHTFFWDTHHFTEFGHVFFAVALENEMAPQHN